MAHPLTTLTSMLLGVALFACQRENPPPIYVSLGTAVDRSFVPRTALAESLVLPGDHNELRLLLAEGGASCERHIPPSASQILLTVTVFAPDRIAIGPGTYTWSHPVLTTDARERPATFAVPKVHTGEEVHLLRPGGGLQLTRVDLGPNGVVEGLLAFESPGDPKGPATHVNGRFAARVCHPDGNDTD